MSPTLFQKLFLLLPIAYPIQNDGEGGNADWTYAQQGSDWTGTCATGQRQSPIRLSIGTSIISPLPRITFVNYDVRLERPLTLTNNGHTVTMDIPQTQVGQRPFIVGGLLNDQFIAQSVHFHWGSPISRGSEHIIQNKRFDAEMHIVHRSARYSQAEASNHTDGLSVVAVMFKIVRKPDRIYPGLRKIFRELPNVINNGEKVNLPGTITLGQLLGDLNTRDFYTYRGSLTTPECNQAVTWTVYPQPLPIPYSDIANFWRIRDEHNALLQNNYRKVQPRNNRAVYYRTTDIRSIYLG